MRRNSDELPSIHRNQHASALTDVTAFSLLVLTERPHPTRLFLKKEKAALLCPVLFRVEVKML